MPKIFLRFAGVIVFFTSTLWCSAQQKVEMADGMRANGKIYVVVAVCLTVLTGLFLYLVFLDRKISRFEKNKD